MANYDILAYGAVGDGLTDNSAAIAAAIEACDAGGGGTVVVPAGTYVTGRIELRSRMTLELEAGSLLLFDTDFERYPVVPTRWSGYECYGVSPLIYGRGLKQVTIKGQGVIDGQGSAWWQVYRQLRRGEKVDNALTREIAAKNAVLTETVRSNIVEWDSQFLRPPLLQLIDCEEVSLEGVTLQNSPFWNTHLVYCKDVHIHGVKIKNPSDTPNGDGMDIDSCTNVRISDCFFDVGDDCLCIKSGIDEDGRRVGKPSENIVITNCTMLRGHGGVVLGSEMAGGIRNVVISNCIFLGTDRGIRMKTNRARGGYIKNILVSNIYMEDVFCPLTINSFYRHGVDESNPLIASPAAVAVTESTPVIDHVRIQQVTAKGCRASAGFIYGLPEMPIRDVQLSHVHIEMTLDPEEKGDEPDMVREKIIMAGDGMLCKHVEDMELHHVRIETRQGPALRLENVRDMEVHDLRMKRLHPDTPVIAAARAEGLFVTGRQSAENGYLQTENGTVSFCG
ncbi:glycoside hydrolase family 28 protein [Paenibacillus sp. GCM10023248]|uniref:glycoside hydrolase family 28 protein n=1 Tax=unclassified Paenibacillus TaxID=185978 RepID=UPI0023783259|nr:glycoside hydrolase family 28 protein [Paenibacillus sp. MAHUQ-63]MDD9266991.1 glycoside hydrolase family 28 protein [Paenibacillus sp. MAHUQ-63]